ncbi:MAG TPA: hypothetical protein VJZ94_01050 [Candidatus Paceibacterota bacterium]|nr:hypothetical protein [Candidatus Paceibacterota bacterium]
MKKLLTPTFYKLLFSFIAILAVGFSIVSAVGYLSTQGAAVVQEEERK